MKALFLSFVLWLGLAASPAGAEDQRGAHRPPPATPVARLALVIGNGAYRAEDYPWKELPNPPNDAADMRQALESLGFQVIFRSDAGYAAMDRAIDEFVDRLTPRTVGLFYFAGHGTEVDGENYLVPVGEATADKSELKARAFNAQMILSRMEERKARLNLMMLDACRDSLFARGRGDPGGLTPMAGASNAIIAFATRAKTTAADGKDRNSPFTRALLAHLREPGRVTDTLQRVQRDVLDLTNGKQEPYLHLGALREDFCLAGCQRPEDAAASERTAWEAIQDSSDPQVFAKYLRNYPEGPHAGEARARMERLAQAKPAEPDPAADAERAAWAAIRDSADPGVFRSYLRNYPNGAHAAEARRKEADAALALALAEAARMQPANTANPQSRPPGSATGPSAAVPPAPERTTAPEPAPIPSLAASLPAAVRDCPECPELVALPGGEFWMGSDASDPDAEADEQPRHRVRVAPFRMGKYEVTQKEWRAVMGGNPSLNMSCSDCPVETVSLKDVETYIARLNTRTGRRYRLPTEAEWEYACRAGGSQRYCGSDDADAVAWNPDNSGHSTQPVGRKRANGFGLHDLSGNVWEWTCSAWTNPYNGSENTCTNDAEGPRVIRGGSWFYRPVYVRSATRNGYDPGNRGYNLGFRLAQDR